MLWRLGGYIGQYIRTFKIFRTVCVIGSQPLERRGAGNSTPGSMSDLRFLSHRFTPRAVRPRNRSRQYYTHLPTAGAHTCSAMIRRNHFPNRVWWHHLPFAINQNLIVITDRTAQRRPAIIEVTTRPTIVSRELRIKLCVPGVMPRRHDG